MYESVDSEFPFGFYVYKHDIIYKVDILVANDKVIANKEARTIIKYVFETLVTAYKRITWFILDLRELIFFFKEKNFCVYLHFKI